MQPPYYRRACKIDNSFVWSIKILSSWQSRKSGNWSMRSHHGPQIIYVEDACPCNIKFWPRWKLNLGFTSISFQTKLGLRLALNNCDCREFYPRTEIYIFTISQFIVTAQSEQELYMWTEHACNSPSTCERVWYAWTGPPTDIGISTCERDHSPRQCHKT